MVKRTAAIRVHHKYNNKVSVDIESKDKLQDCVNIITFNGREKTKFPYTNVSKASVAEFLIDRYYKELQERLS